MRSNKAAKAAKFICPAVFLAVCILVIQFMHLFTVSDSEMHYINFTESVQVLANGSETPYDPAVFSNEGGIAGTYRFSGELPQNTGSGNLVFEVSSMACTLYINGDEVYRSEMAAPAGVNMAQAYIPYDGSGGTVTLICTLNGEPGAMFPPMLRFMPDGITETQSTAFADLYALPAGAAATALIIVCGLFLLGITRGKPDYSMIPLAAAVFMLMAHRLIQGVGYYFLPAEIVNFFSDARTGWITVAALALYLVMNRQRDFWRYMGIAVGASAAVLLIVYLISLGTGGTISAYINFSVPALFSAGAYDGLLYWFTYWLAAICALISAYRVMHEFAVQRANQQSLELKNELVMSSYRAIESKMRAGNEARHEWRHRLAAMNALYNSGDMDGIGKMLSDLSEQAENALRIRYSENFAVNAILQDCSTTAAKAGIEFTAHVSVPKEISVTEMDLCTLLMNMLDNAIEACRKQPDGEKQYIQFKAEIKNGFLAVRCENSYSGETEIGRNGLPQTTKKDPSEHGFGMLQMETVAERYGSVLDIAHDEKNGVFTVQTALKLP